MPRTRSLKPQFFTDADLSEQPPLHRILFAGLWCQADREGRLEDKPKELKVQILPYDPYDVDAALNDLARAGFIQRYEAGGRRLISIPAFKDHQHPHKDEKASVLPGPPEFVPVGSGGLPGQPPVGSGATPEEAPLEHGAKTPVSCFLSLGSGSLSLGAGAAPEQRAPLPPPPEIELFTWFQDARLKAAPSVLPEVPPPDYLGWHPQALKAVGGKAERLCRGYVEFLRDPWARGLKPPYPIRAYMKKFREYVPPESEAA